MEILNEVTFTFDDLLILPAATSEITSRRSVDTSTFLFDVELPFPLISASMSVFDMTPEGEISVNFAREIYKAGGLHIFSRRTPLDARLSAATELSDEGVEVGIAVSLFEFTLYRAVLEDSNFFISIDIANGAIIPEINDWSGHYPLIVGNFGNADAVYRNELNVIQKYGIGGGSACSTRLVTGVGAPQAWLIKKVSDTLTNRYFIADGGVKTVGDFSKAVALGADAVMVGSLLAGASETPRDPVKIDGKWYKPYHGEASAAAKDTNRFIEGVEGFVLYEGKSIHDIVNEFSDGLRSAMSYVGARDLLEFRYDSRAVRVSPATVYENGTRIYASS